MLINSPNISGSLTVTGNIVASGSLTVAGIITGTVAGTTATASYVEYNNVANKPTLVSGSSQITYSGLTGIPSGIVSGSAQIEGFGIFATTGSNQFNGNQAITGSLTTTGTIVAQTLNVQQVTSSIVFSSGSNIFGNSVANTQQFTGSLQVTGSTHHLLGNVGVGTTSPELRLDVKDVATGGSIGMFIENAAASTLNNSADIYFGTWGGASIGGITNARISAVNVDAGNAATDLLFHTYNGSSSAERMRIISTGNIGIGIAAPVRLSGRILSINDTSVNLQSSIELLRNGASSGEIFVNSDNMVIGSFESTIPLTFRTQNQERVRITSGGNFGIGTASPGVRFEVEANNPTRGIIASITNGAVSGHTGSQLKFTQNGVADWVIGQPAGVDAFSIWSGRFPSGDGTERIRITSSGNVGIGTASPSRTLHILGASGIGTVLKLEGASGTTTYLQLAYNGATDGQSGYIGYDSSANMPFFTSNTERMRITSDGDLILGRTNYDPKFYMTSTGGNGINERFYIDGYAHGGGAGYGGGFRLYTRDTVNVFQQRLTIDSGGAATFLGNVTAANVLFWNNGVGALSWDTGLVTMETNTSTAIVLKTNGNERMRITAGGSVLIGTATDAGSRLQVEGGNFRFNWANPSADHYLWLNRNSARDGGILLTKDNVLDWQIVNISTSGNLVFYSYGSTSNVLTLTRSTGAAIFSSTVTAGGTILSTNAGVDGTFADAFVGRYNANVVEQNAIQTSVSSAAQSSGFKFQASNGGGSSGRTTVVDFLRDRQIFYGNVGIGISSPIARQHNAISSSGTALLLNNTAGGGGAFVDLDFVTYGTGQVGYANAGATIRIIDDGNFSGHITFRTKGGSVGASQTERLRIEASTGHIVPGANGTQDLGSSSLRWSTVFTSDLSLSNGIGDYTIVEGEHDLFLYNNKNNKVYKFVVEEVDPSTATPKKS